MAFTEQQVTNQRQELKDELYRYMEMVEDPEGDMTLEQFGHAVDRVMMTLERDIAATVGEARPSRILQKLRDGAL